MKSLFIFGGLIFCLCVAFISIQLNTHARYQLEHILQENQWDNSINYTDITHKLFSSTGQMIGVKLYAYPYLYIDKLTIAELTPTKAIVVAHNMDLDVLHSLQRQTDAEATFRTYQPITHLLQRPLHSLLLINQPIVRMEGKLVIVTQTPHKAIVDMTINAPQIGQIQIRTFLYPVSDNFIHDFLTAVLQGYISSAYLAELPIVKTEIVYADKGGLRRYRDYLDTLPNSLVAQAKQSNPQLAQFIQQPKSELKIDGHPFRRTQPTRKSKRK